MCNQERKPMPIFKNRYDLNNTPIESRSGFYILCLNRSIPKIRDEDVKGILYIGKSKNLANRLVLLSREKWQEKIGKKSSYTFDHSALTFAVDFEENGDLIPHHLLIKNGIIKNSDTLTLHVFYNESPSEKEKQLLDSHVNQFGQLPPFNSQGSSLKSIGESDRLVIENSFIYFDEIYQSL